MTNNKILALPQLALELRRLKAQGKTVVLCHGVFDLLHIGHIRYFNQAREMGDILVVTVTPDRYVDTAAHRPTFTEDLRAEAIASLQVADFVAVNEWPTAERVIELLHPDVYVKGAEYKKPGSDPGGKLERELEMLKKVGGRMAYTEEIVFSASNLINRYLSNFPDEVKEYLRLFRQRHGLDVFRDILSAMTSMRVLVIGETILDDYHYCEALGKSSKDPVLALRFQNNDIYAGGILAVANHAAGFAGQLTVATALGDRDSQEELIRSRLSPQVDPVFFTQKDAPTIVKRRFLDGYTFSKLLEVYDMNDAGLDPEAEEAFVTWLTDNLADFDVVIVADYGHGLLSPRLIETLVNHAKFLAVNTQANAGNRGFNTISKYPRADFVSLAEHEMRLEVKSANGILTPHLKELGKRLSSSYFVVTRGRKGCSVWTGNDDFVEVPAFAQRVVDRTGAGDAFLSITAMAAKLGADPELVGFLGNIVGSLAVEIVGNQKAVDKAGVEKLLATILK